MASKERNSSLELLRIVAMFMIIAYHIYYHSFYVELTDTDSITRMGNGLFCDPIFYPKLLIPVTIAPMGKAGNAVFILISGYFLAARSGKINLIKIAKKLLSQHIFAAIVLVLGSTYCFEKSVDTIITTIDINYMNQSMAWFVGYYFLLIVIADLFLNRFLEKLGQTNYLKLLLVIFALTQFEWAAGLIGSIASGLKTLTAGIFLYSLGGYIRKYDPFERCRSFFIILLIIFCNLLVYISFYNLTANNVQEYLLTDMSKPYIQVMPKFADSYLIPMVLGICIFELFRRLPPVSSKIINFIASSTFMIYLLHDNKFFYSLWDAVDWITLLSNSNAAFLFTFFKWILMVFVFGFVVYCLFLILGLIWKECRFLFIREDEDDFDLEE